MPLAPPPTPQGWVLKLRQLLLQRPELLVQQAAILLTQPAPVGLRLLAQGHPVGLLL